MVAAIHGSTSPHGTKAPVSWTSRPRSAEDARIGIDRELEVPELVALLVGAEEILAPVLDPFHRPPE